MSTAAKSYVKQMARHIKYYATWLPTMPLSLGDYGVMENKYLFRRLGSIGDRGVVFETLTDESDSAIDFKTSGSVSMSTDVSASIPGITSAAAQVVDVETMVTFGFKKANSVVFRANGVRNHSIRDQTKLGQKIMQLFMKGRWEKNWKVITSLVEADTATIIVANSSSSQLKLMAKGDIRAVMDLADAKLGLTVTHDFDMAYTDIASSGLKPLFQISGIKRSPFSEPRFESLRFKGAIDEIELVSAEEIRAEPTKFEFGRDEFPLLFEDDE